LFVLGWEVTAATFFLDKAEADGSVFLLDVSSQEVAARRTFTANWAFAQIQGTSLIEREKGPQALSLIKLGRADQSLRGTHEFLQHCANCGAPLLELASWEE
jgi:hypothetical protein